jgi:SHS2 domain-containing protein
MKPRYEQLEHTADVALRVYGGSLQELFANAAYAMFSQLADLTQIQPAGHELVSVEGSDYESLLVNWLNELLYLHEVRNQVYSVFDITELSQRGLQATVRGAHASDVYTIVKAATYHDLAICRTAEGYSATIVLDV